MQGQGEEMNYERTEGESKGLLNLACIRIRMYSCAAVTHRVSSAIVVAVTVNAGLERTLSGETS